MRTFSKARPILAIVLCSMLAACSRAAAPMLPPPLAPAISGHHFHVTPFFDFKGGKTGANPQSPLLDVSGMLFGTSLGPGSSCTRSGGCGIVYVLTPSGDERVLHVFTGGKDGSSPRSGLVAATRSLLFGTTSDGGGGCRYRNGCGTVFKMIRSGSGYAENIVYAFRAGREGANPYGPVTIDAKGNLYGTTVDGGNPCPALYGGGVGGCGTVYELRKTASGYAASIVYRFKGGTDGKYPQDALIEDSGGNLFGTTPAGGTGCDGAGCGVVFELRRTATGFVESVIFRFGANSADGTVPRGPILLYKKALYGTTMAGGTHNESACMQSSPYAFYVGCGTVYRLEPTASGFHERTLYDFKGGKDGIAPSAGVTLRNGALYGTTRLGGSLSCGQQSGGAEGCGTVFALAVAGNYSVQYRFQGPDGSNPVSPLNVNSDGTLSGTASNGGAYSFGTAFRF